MKISVHKSSVFEVLQILRKKKAQEIDQAEVERVFSHEDYLFEFGRYQGRLSREEMIRYFLNFEYLKSGQIENEDLCQHHCFWLDFYFHVDEYEDRICEFLENFNDEQIFAAYEQARKGFPEGYTIPECKVVFTCGIGRSFGYPYQNGIHFDVLRLMKEQEIMEDFQEIIAHELHHLIYNQNIHIETEDIEGYFLQCFAGEGLAIKFTNNAQGLLSKKMYEDLSSNIGLDKESIAYLNLELEQSFSELKGTIQKIHMGEIKTRDEVDTLICEYWLSLYHQEEPGGVEKLLAQPRLYTMGNEIWGTIFDVYGMDELYRIVNEPKECLEKFNHALWTIGKPEYCIE
ncbi:DUF5700 domain-containing putative Zn-dependent protease [Roseburia hominis]